jgi:hypothetical protein
VINIFLFDVCIVRSKCVREFVDSNINEDLFYFSSQDEITEKATSFLDKFLLEIYGKSEKWENGRATPFTPTRGGVPPRICLLTPPLFSP